MWFLSKLEKAQLRVDSVMSFISLGLFLLLTLSLDAAYASSGALRAPRITEHPVDVIVPRGEPATLKCSADGNPPPTIQWYRDGDLVSTAPSEPKSHRVLLPDGGLFFLRVVQSRKDNDGGSYWCVARNSAGTARSKTANLTVAYLQPEFRVSPQPVRAIQGETAVLECEPPRGVPEPIVRWRKNGQFLDISSSNARLRVEEGGNLVITRVGPNDEGRYQCSAQNVAGTRETNPVQLSVHVKPQIVHPPADITAVVGSDVTFECGAIGDPSPHVVWRRMDGSLPAGRARLTESKAGLRIERVTLADEGKYVCELENLVGTAAASATLTVTVPPTLSPTPPREVRVEPGHTAYLHCGAEGAPEPLLYWSRENHTHPYIVPAESNRGKWTVLSNGTLQIQNANSEDAGVWSCAAINSAGGVVYRTRLEVAAPLSQPPVVIESGPANQTLPLRSQATMVCKIEGHSVRWTKDGSPLTASAPRVTILNSGVLKIEDLQSSDAGMYTCWAGSDTQATAWSAQLNVESPTNPNVVFMRSPSDPMALPGSPSQPRLINRTTTSVTISWQSSTRMGASPLQGYIVEVYSPHDTTIASGVGWHWGGQADAGGNSGQGVWKVLTRKFMGDVFTMHNLQPGSAYVFLVRAENSHGLSLPSPVSPWFSTLREGAGESEEMAQVRELLDSHVVRLQQAKAVNSTTVRLSWEVLDGDMDVEGFHVWYCENLSATRARLEESAPKVRSKYALPSTPFNAEDIKGNFSQFLLATVLNPRLTAYTVTNLKPFTEYLFFLVPYLQGIEGRPSNNLEEMTAEDAPSGPPATLIVRQINVTSALVQWTPPAWQHRNGIIKGYQIYVSADGGEQSLANLTLPASSTSVVVGGLMIGTQYIMRAAAWTKTGLGPATAPVSLRMEAVLPPMGVGAGIGGEPGEGITSDLTEVVQETWFILLIGGLLLCVLVLLVTGLIMRRRMARKKALGHLTATLHKTDDISHVNINGRDLFWSRGWQPTDCGKDPKMLHSALSTPTAPEYAELTNGPLSTFFPRKDMNSEPPAAYATTTLVSSMQRAPAGSMDSRKYTALSTSGMLRLDSRNSGSDDSNPRRPKTTEPAFQLQGEAGQPLLDNSPISDSSSYTTDENGVRIKGKKRGNRTKRDNGVNGGMVPNWSELLPPPPSHPPPPGTWNERNMPQQQQVNASSLKGVQGWRIQGSPAFPKRPSASELPFGNKAPSHPQLVWSGRNGVDSRSSGSSSRGSSSRGGVGNNSTGVVVNHGDEMGRAARLSKSKLTEYAPGYYRGSENGSQNPCQDNNSSSGCSMDRGIQSSLPSLVQDSVQRFRRPSGDDHQDSDTEAGPEYSDLESYYGGSNAYFSIPCGDAALAYTNPLHPTYPIHPNAAGWSSSQGPGTRPADGERGSDSGSQCESDVGSPTYSDAQYAAPGSRSNDPMSCSQMSQILGNRTHKTTPTGTGY